MSKIREEFEKAFEDWCKEGNHSYILTQDSAKWAFIQGMKKAAGIAKSKRKVNILFEILAEEILEKVKEFEDEK